MESDATTQSKTRPSVKVGPLINAPALLGYTYTGKEAYAARDENRLLSIRLETNRSCNLRCLYCYAQSGRRLKNELTFKELCSIIEQAKSLGVRSIVIIGGGEPTIHPKFRDLVTCIHSLDIRPVLFTNTINMTPDLAKFLYDSGASVMGKLDSLRPDLQDFLAGCNGAGEKIRIGLKNLIDAGFTQTDDPRRLRFGVSFVSCRLNLEEIEAIWHFCRERNIFPNMEVLTPTGRAKDTLADCGLTREEIRTYKLKLLEIDRTRYGYDWLPYTPLTASGCLQHLYSLYVTIEGNIRPCAPTKFDEHPDLKIGGIYPYNIRVHSLEKIYNDELFRFVRDIDHHLEGKCGHCEYLQECIGCRGYAYSVGVNNGMAPRAALASECLQCFK